MPAVADAEGFRRGQTRAGASFKDEGKAHYDSLRDLRRAHPLTFSSRSTHYLLERPISTRIGGLSESVVRISVEEPDPRGVLFGAFRKLFAIYPAHSKFYVTVSCNAVLATRDGASFSLWFGHDFSESRAHDIYVGEVVKVRSFSDVARIPTNLTVEDFQASFQLMFESSDVHVHSLACLVYKITKVIPNFGRDQLYGQQFRVLV